MGLFDEVNKAVVNQQLVNDYSAVLGQSGITISNLIAVNNNGELTVSGTVPDMETAEKTVVILKN